MLSSQMLLDLQLHVKNAALVMFGQLNWWKPVHQIGRVEAKTHPTQHIHMSDHIILHLLSTPKNCTLPTYNQDLLTNY